MTLDKKKGVLLVNIGTPAAPETKAVRSYLKEFLSDSRVIDIWSFFRFFLLYFIILPFRSPKSAAAYRSIWLFPKQENSGVSPQGESPLMFYSQKLGQKVSQILGRGYVVEVCMRYQQPSLENAIEKICSQNVDHIVIFPVFPQYSSAATGSVLQKVSQLLCQRWNIPQFSSVGPFYSHPGFIASFCAVLAPQLEAFQPDFILFSYHGLPERHIRKSDRSLGSHCLVKKNCCEEVCVENLFCYKSQCYATTQALLEKLAKWPIEKTMTSFQSRLGRDPWIQPHTDVVLPQLFAQGVRRLAVVCPAFVVDCLETLEEIQIRAREQWLLLGGTDLQLMTSLNDSDLWAQTVAHLVKEKVS